MNLRNGWIARWSGPCCKCGNPIYKGWHRVKRGPGLGQQIHLACIKKVA